VNCPKCGEDWSDVAVVRNAKREALAASPAPLDPEGPDDEHADWYRQGWEAGHAAALAATPAPHDCFWDGQPIKATGKPTDIASLRMDVTDEEADAFLAAIEEVASPAPLDVERLEAAVFAVTDSGDGPERWEYVGTRTAFAEAIAREYAQSEEAKP